MISADGFRVDRPHWWDWSPRFRGRTILIFMRRREAWISHSLRYEELRDNIVLLVQQVFYHFSGLQPRQVIQIRRRCNRASLLLEGDFLIGRLTSLENFLLQRAIQWVQLIQVSRGGEVGAPRVSCISRWILNTYVLSPLSFGISDCMMGGAINAWIGRISQTRRNCFRKRRGWFSGFVSRSGRDAGSLARRCCLDIA